MNFKKQLFLCNSIFFWGSLPSSITFYCRQIEKKPFQYILRFIEMDAWESLLFCVNSNSLKINKFPRKSTLAVSWYPLHSLVILVVANVSLGNVKGVSVLMSSQLLEYCFRFFTFLHFKLVIPNLPILSL